MKKQSTNLQRLLSTVEKLYLSSVKKEVSEALKDLDGKIYKHPKKSAKRKKQKKSV